MRACDGLVRGVRVGLTANHGAALRRGSILASRLGMYYPTRFAGLAFLASGYCPPLAGFDLKAVLAHQREHVGTELFGYWLYAPWTASSFATFPNDHVYV